MSRSELRPNLRDVSISLDLIASWGSAGIVSDRAFRALTRLVAQCAGGLVWTYSEPGDGSLDADPKILARYAGVSTRQWPAVWAEIKEHFASRRGRIHLVEEWISIANQSVRFALPAALKTDVSDREGHTCTYCGDISGPFEFDHIFPVSRGGKDVPSNITLACVPCNRSKGAKTLREWMASR